jgi:hypothetical protein
MRCGVVRPSIRLRLASFRDWMQCTKMATPDERLTCPTSPTAKWHMWYIVLHLRLQFLGTCRTARGTMGAATRRACMHLAKFPWYGKRASAFDDSWGNLILARDKQNHRIRSWHGTRDKITLPQQCHTRASSSKIMAKLDMG